MKMSCDVPTGPDDAFSMGQPSHGATKHQNICCSIWEPKCDSMHCCCIPFVTFKNSQDLFLLVEVGTISSCKSTPTFFHPFFRFALQYYIKYITLRICFSPHTTSITSHFTFLPFFFHWSSATGWKPSWVMGARDCCHLNILKGTDLLMEIESERLDSMGKVQIDKFSEWISPNLTAYNICIYWA